MNKETLIISPSVHQMTESVALVSPDTVSIASSKRSWSRSLWSPRSQTALLAVLILVFIGKTVVPAWRHYGGDFSNYYLVAKLYREHRSVERVYEWEWFQREEDHSGIGPQLVGFIPATPISALPIAPLASLPILQAHRYWLTFNIVLLAAIAILLKRITQLRWTNLGVLILLATNPLHNHLAEGQMHLVVLLLLTVAAVLYSENILFWCGIAVAAAAAMKIYPALFLLYFVLKKEWRAVWGLAVGGAGTVAAWVGLFGADAFLTYVRHVLPWGLRGENIDPYDIGWDSLSALLHRLLIAEPGLNPSPVVHWPALYSFLQAFTVAVILVAFLWAMASGTGDGSTKKLHWASYVFLLLMLSSEPLTYHFVALILAAVLVVDYLLAHHEATKAGIVTVVYALVCLPYNRLYRYEPAGWRSVLFFPRLFFMTIFGGLLLWILLRSSSESLIERLKSRNARLAALAVIVLSAGGFAENIRHLRGHFQNYASRVLTVPSSPMAADPVVTSHGLLFTSLVTHRHTSIQQAYAGQEYRHGSVTSFFLGDDSYHPAAATEGDVVWVEVATSAGSRIVRFRTAPLSSVTDTTLEIEDAEQPVVSSDGELLAFIRVVGGRDSLWIRHLKAGTRAQDHQVASSDFDVREAAFFPDDRLVFSSRREGRFRLYVVNPSSNAAEEMPIPTCSARYPAVSPDGKRIAFACEGRGYWQLESMDLSTGRETTLTDGECNHVSPAWTLDSRSLIYATDCGRGLGLTALAKLEATR